MNIGIIVFSATGNTFSVAKKLEERFAAKGHQVTLERVTAMNEDPRASGGNALKHAPSAEPYDVLVFGAPVWGFSLSGVMKAYLSQLASLKGKTAGCFVTQQLSRAWMGGNQAVGQMSRACKEKGAAVFGTGIINWSGKRKEDQINELIEKMTRL